MKIGIVIRLSQDNVEELRQYTGEDDMARAVTLLLESAIGAKIYSTCHVANPPYAMNVEVLLRGQAATRFDDISPLDGPADAATLTTKDVRLRRLIRSSMIARREKSSEPVRFSEEVFPDSMQ